MHNIYQTIWRCLQTEFDCSSLLSASPMDQGHTTAQLVIARGFIDHRRTCCAAGVSAHPPHAQAGHSHPILRHLVVGNHKRVEPPLGFAPVFLFLVKTLLAFIAAYPDPKLPVLLFQVEV